MSENTDARDDVGGDRAGAGIDATQTIRIADRIRPFLGSFFQGTAHEDGSLIRPSTVRGMTLRMARNLLEKHKQNSRESSEVGEPDIQAEARDPKREGAEA